MGVFWGNPQQRPRDPGYFAPALFPVAQSRNPNPDKFGEFGLRELEFFPYFLWAFQLDNTCGLAVAPFDFKRLPQPLFYVFEYAVFSFHFLPEKYAIGAQLSTPDSRKIFIPKSPIIPKFPKFVSPPL